MEANQTTTLPALLASYLSKHPNGVPFDVLLTDLEAHASAEAITQSLNQAVNDGTIRPSYQAGAPSSRWGHRTSNILFYASSSLPLLRATPNEINEVVRYFAAREDYERHGGGPWVMLEASKVFEDFATKHQMPAAKVAHIFETLRSEGMLRFEARSANGYISVTLSAHRNYTVVALQADEPAYRGASHKYHLRYFHVRAGSAEIACQKVNRVHIEDGELEVQSVVEGLVNFEAPPNCSEVVIESL